MQGYFRWLLVFLLFAALLRFTLLGSKSLWFDEAFSARYSGNLVSQIINPGWQKPDPHPPLYYLGLHYWIELFGDRENSIRMPSAVLSLGNVGLLFLLGSRVFNPKIGLMAAGLLSVAPLSIWYAQEARMYAAVTFLGLLAALFLSWDRWLALPLLGLTLAVGFYVDYTFFVLWTVLSAVWFVHWWYGAKVMQPLWTWLVATVGAFILYIPWGNQFLLFINNFNDFHIFERLQQQIGFPILSPAEILILFNFFGIGVVVLVFVVWRLFQYPNLRKGLILFLLFIFIIATIVFAIPRFYTVKRFLLLVWPYFILGVSWGLMQLGKWRIRLWIGLLGLSLAAALVVLFLVPKDDWRSVVRYINANVAAGDVVWIDPPWNRTAFAYYEPTIDSQSGDAVALQEAIYSDVWLIAERPHGKIPPTSQSERVFDKNLKLVESIPFYRLEVRRYGSGKS